MEELQQISELTLEVVGESLLTTRINNESEVTPFVDKQSQVTSRLRFISKLPW